MVPKLVLWMRTFFRKNWKLLLSALVIACLFCYPYLVKDFLGVEHDTFFHLSRIQGLAESFSRGDFLPAVYPYKNNGFGYASPLFYSDFWLIIPALLYNAGLSLASCYKFFIFCCVYFSCFSMMKLCLRITKHEYAAILAGAAYVFANYHITDVYVRGASGEVLAMVFIPIVLSGFYELLENQNAKEWKLLAFGLTGLVLSHNLSFAIVCVICVLFVLIYIRKIKKDIWIALFKSVGIAFALSAFFTLPMLEQLSSQTFYLDYYASSSDLGSQSMELWQYFANTTVFGLGGNTYEKSNTMLENVGWFLTFAPLLWLAVPVSKRREHSFVAKCMIIGYIFLILPSVLIPWNSMSFLRILQFPWRLEMFAMALLCIPACASFAFLRLKSKNIVIACTALLLSAEALWHLTPALNRTFGITSNTAYEQMIDGTIIDPYYSATYVRVECAGGDYLPSGSPDFRSYSAEIKDAQGNDLSISYEKKGTSLSFSLDADTENTQIILPITYYKGYQVYKIADGRKTAIETFESNDRMVSFFSTGEGDYICTYSRTPIQIGSAAFSLGTAALLIILAIRKRYNK